MTRVRSESHSIKIRPPTSAVPGLTLSTVIRYSSEATLEEKFLAKKAAWERVGKSLRTTHSLFLGDAREMKGLRADAPVHLVVTSPPYWNLKRYADDRRGAQLAISSTDRSFWSNWARSGSAATTCSSPAAGCAWW